MKQKFHFDHTEGKIHVETIQNIGEVLKSVKLSRENNNGWSPKRNLKKIAEVPEIFIHKWIKESGLRYGTREFMDYCKKKLKDPDYSGFRV